MIRAIRVKNWLSYSEASIEDLDQSRVIAVVGENGSGKSALLEAVPYALYGLSRATAGEMTRIGESEHSVEVELVGDYAGGGQDVLTVTRGRDRSGKGFSEVRINGTLQSKGGETSDNVSEILGIDDSEFMLTAFFGLGGSSKQDTLLSVTPAQRLETLQKIAKVDIYKDFQAKAKLMRQGAESDRTLNAREIETLEGTLEAPEDIQSEIEGLSSQLEETRKGHELLVGERNTLTTEMDRYTALVRERDVLSADIRNSAKQISDLESEYDTDIAAIETVKGKSKALIATRDTLAAQVDEMTRKATSVDCKAIEAQISSKATLKEIKELGTRVDSGSCPLCGSEIGPETVSQWEADIEKIESEIRTLSKQKSANLKEIADLETLSRRHESCIATLTSDMNEAAALEKRAEALKNRVRSATGDAESLRTRREKLERDLDGNYDRITQRIKLLTVDIESLREHAGSIESGIKAARERMSEMQRRQKRIKVLVSLVADQKREAESLSVLEKAFSRYGIPMQLLEGLRGTIEERATSIYREFDNGVIRIEDTEGARPGVDFVLMDQKGRRPYKLLSQGESAMFYLSVRIAVGEAVAENGGGVDFLILDELTANLSPNRRDDLVRVIGKVLRLRYPQIAMVSHASMREVFDREVTVEVRNGVSVAESRGR